MSSEWGMGSAMTSVPRRSSLLWKFWLFLLTAHYLLLTPTHPALATEVEDQDGLPIVYLAGTPHDIGYQHGVLLREQVRATVSQVLGYFRHALKIPGVRALAVNLWLAAAWRDARPFIPPAYLEELTALSEGSGVPLRELYRLHAIPDRTYSCSNLAAWGRATAGGRLIHLRNLDWNMRAGLQRSAVLFVVRPAGKHAFVSAGWAGFIGVLSGINDRQISVGQVGAQTQDLTFKGEPMAFLMRRVLEEADDVDDAATRVISARRTVGTNYVFADAQAKRGIVVETTAHHARVFEANDPAERGVGYARPIADAVFRADAAMDPIIRDRQIASHGNPRQPGLEAPGGSAYEVRYLGQAAGIRAHFGTLDGVIAQTIAAAVAPNSNIQSVVFAWPELWVANAQGMTPAAKTRYHHFDLERLFARR